MSSDSTPTGADDVDADVVVVGGGPAGVAAAVTLRRAGRSVTLVDKARFPRDKFCGDGLTTAALRELEALGLDPSSVDSWHRVERVTVRAPFGREVVFPLPSDGTFAAVATRVDLDAAVLDLARASGVNVLEDHALRKIDQSADRVAVTAGDRTIRGAWVVAADGMWSPTRKALGVATPHYLGEWHAFRQYVRGAEQLDERMLYVSFDADILPGYFWAFPLGGGRANIGFGIARGGKVSTQEMKELWPALLERDYVRRVLGPSYEPEGPHRAWPIPCRVEGMVAAAGRTLFAGDAVSAADPMTGEGIGQALLTGRLAAEQILTGDEPAQVRDRYRRALDKELAPDQAMSRLLTGALRHRRGAAIATSVAGTSAWTRRNFARWLFEDYPRAVITTPARWEHGVFSRRGAFRD